MSKIPLGEQVAVTAAAPGIVVSTPYRENSIAAIARMAATTDRLARFHTTFYTGSLPSVIGRLPLVGARLTPELGRRSFPGIPSAKVMTGATLAEVAHVLLARAFGTKRPQIPRDLMYMVKARLDRIVARRMVREDSNILVGMYGAAQYSFEVAKQRDRLCILNFVNSHPLAHNRYLRDLAGLEDSHHEMIPDWVAKRVERELSLADLVLVPSRFVAAQLIARGVLEEKIAVIPYGVDLSAFRAPTLQPAPDDCIECLFVGQISYRKGVHVLLNVARACRSLPVRFRLCGPVVSPELIEDLPENAHYDGPIPPGRVPAAMQEADILLVPSLEDAYGLVVLEAMASGLPVITTSNAGTSELLSNGRNGVVVPAGDVESIVAALTLLVHDVGARLQMSAAAAATVASRPWEAFAEAAIARIDELQAARRQAL